MAEQKQTTSLEQLARNEYAALAGSIAKTDPAMAVNAMRYHYYKAYGLTKDDPIIGQSLERAMEGVGAGTGIGDSALVHAIGLYSQHYGSALENATVATIVKRAMDKGYKIPAEALEGLKKYMTYTVSQLKEVAKGKNDEGKEAKKALTAISIIDTQKLKGNLYAELMTDMSNETLVEMYKKKEEEGRKAA
ncbi:MAG: hypothetical protein ACPLXC_00200 [Candidatus Pacearchaeota archaeon]